MTKLKRIAGHRVLHLRRTASTMDAARREAARGAPDGLAVLTDFQITGRGRRGTRWHCPRGAGLLVSVLTREPAVERDSSLSTILASVAAAEACRRACRVKAWIKWPNDVVIDDGELKKLGGVLVEKILTPNAGPTFILGIGINANMDREQLPDLVDVPATSLLLCSGKAVDRDALLAELLSRIDFWREKLRSGKAWRLRRRWRELMALTGMVVEAIADRERVTGLVTGVSRRGELEIELPDGSVKRLVAETTRILRARRAIT